MIIAIMNITITITTTTTTITTTVITITISTTSSRLMRNAHVRIFYYMTWGNLNA